jgi:hypothetical protein
MPSGRTWGSNLDIHSQNPALGLVHHEGIGVIDLIGEILLHRVRVAPHKSFAALLPYRLIVALRSSTSPMVRIALP